MSRNLVIGDIHGMYGRLRSVLSHANFNPQEDNLYALGDFCDRGPMPVRMLDYLMSLPHFFPIIGNHDIWLYEYLCTGTAAPIWLDPRNGGRKTYSRIRRISSEKKARIREWYGTFPLLRTIGDKIILHAGPSESVSTEEELLKQTESITLKQAYETKLRTGSYSPLVRDIVWDRDYLRTAMKLESESGPDRDPKVLRDPFATDKNIICGHTPLKEVFHSDAYHITCIDTGSFALEGHITVMDLDTGELFTSQGL